VCGLATILAVFSQVFVVPWHHRRGNKYFLRENVLCESGFFMFSTLSDLISDLVVDAVVLIARLAGVFVVVCDLAWEQAVSCSA